MNGHFGGYIPGMIDNPRFIENTLGMHHHGVGGVFGIAGNYDNFSFIEIGALNTYAWSVLGFSGHDHETNDSSGSSSDESGHSSYHWKLSFTYCLK